MGFRWYLTTVYIKYCRSDFTNSFHWVVVVYTHSRGRRSTVDLRTGWGGESWTKTFLSLYRPLYLIEAYVRPEKYWLLWAGPLANHINNFYFIFLSDGFTVAAERAACFADLNRR